MSGSSRPMSTKTKPLRMKPIIFQVLSHRTRLLGVRIVPSRPPTTRPAVTAARTPDRPHASAGRKAANGMTREIATSTGGSSRRRSSHTAPRPTMIPSATPPTAATKNPTRASERTKLPVTTASTAARYATRADASLKRDSPSMRVTTTRGAPSRRKTLVAASASVGATIAPRANAAPAEVRHDRMRDDGDAHHREDHEADRQARDRHEVRAQVAPRRRDSGAEEQRRQEDQQHQLRLERDRRQAGHECEAEAAEHHQGRERDTQPAGELVQDRDRDEDGQDRDEDLHPAMMPFRAGVMPLAPPKRSGAVSVASRRRPWRRRSAPVGARYRGWEDPVLTGLKCWRPSDRRPCRAARRRRRRAPTAASMKRSSIAIRWPRRCTPGCIVIDQRGHRARARYA